MSFWKKASLITAGTLIAGPLGGLAAGAGAVYLDNKKEKKEKERIKANAEIAEQENIETIESLNSFEKLFEYELKNIADNDERIQIFIALFAVGIGTANCDGEISIEEQNDINDFLEILKDLNLSNLNNETIKKYLDNPPIAQDAVKEILKLKNPNWELFIKAISIISEADGIIKDEEIAYLNEIKKHKEAK